MSVAGEIHRTMQLVTCAAVVHNERARAICLSKNGNVAEAKWLPKRPIIFEMRTAQPFIAISIPKWLALSKGFFAHHRELTITRSWTQEELLAWDWARSVALNIRRDVDQTRPHQQAIGPLAGRNHYA